MELDITWIGEKDKCISGHGYIYNTVEVIMEVNEKTLQTVKRDRIAKLFLPLFEDILDSYSADALKQIIRMMLNNGEIKRKRSAANEPDGKEWICDTYVSLKKSELVGVYFRYQRMFELCKVLGIKHIYDLGCCFINQSLLLTENTNLVYIGIDSDQFVLNDFRKKDFQEKNIYYTYSNEAPSSFCRGRISFVKAEYPFPVNPLENNIAISSYSLTKTRNPEKISTIADAFGRDFERILFNTYQESVVFWKEYAGKNFCFFPIGYSKFVFGTRITKDIVHLKEQYPFYEGRFWTGIDNYMEYMSIAEIDPDGSSGYIQWN